MIKLQFHRVECHCRFSTAFSAPGYRVRDGGAWQGRAWRGGGGRVVLTSPRAAVHCPLPNVACALCICSVLVVGLSACPGHAPRNPDKAHFLFIYGGFNK